jgi:predicted RND superfamily exporter protein
MLFHVYLLVFYYPLESKSLLYASLRNVQREFLVMSILILSSLECFGIGGTFKIPILVSLMSFRLKLNMIVCSGELHIVSRVVQKRSRKQCRYSIFPSMFCSL